MNRIANGDGAFSGYLPYRSFKTRQGYGEIDFPAATACLGRAPQVVHKDRAAPRWYFQAAARHDKVGYRKVYFPRRSELAKIPQVLHEHINTAYPANVCLIGTVLPNGFAQITPRGSVMVYDDEHIALWERGRGTTAGNLVDGTAVTLFMRKTALRDAGILPKGGILRLYGRAKVYKSGADYEEVWKRLIEPEKKNDADKKGYAVLVAIERVEDLAGQPLG
jgi:hypothetical protein